MLGVTNLRGDVRSSTVMQYWTCALGLARRPNRGGPQRVGHLGPVQNKSPPSRHARQEDDDFSGRNSGVMADDGIQRKIPVEDNMDWVADDPRTTATRFELGEHYPEDLFTEIEEQNPPNREIRIHGARQRICTAFRNGGIPMYQIVFEHMGLRLLFSDLEVAIFNHLEVCPSQLHPNSLAFIRAFEIVAAYLKLAPTIPLFFAVFGIQRSRPRGNVTNKCGWVSLKQHRKLFDIFEESLRSFKDEYFVVRPMAVEGWKAILVRGPKLDDDGNVVFGDDAEPIEVDCERFPFCWSTKYYSREAKSFTFKRGALSKEESADLKLLEDFVDSFPPNLWEDREGNPICDEEGHQLSSKKFVNTKALLKCATKTEAEELLRMFFFFVSTDASLRKLQEDKKRRQAGGATSSTPNISGQSSPTPFIEVTGERRVAEEPAGDPRPPKQARVDGGGGVVSGPRKQIPGRAAAEFVIPPAKGHDCLLDGKTTIKVSEADQTILASMGPESLWNVVAESSVAVFKLLEVATFLNDRECKYLRERDEARAHTKDFGERLTTVEQDLLTQGKALEDSEAEVARVKKELEDAKGEEEKLKGKITELEERIGDMQLDVASSSFQNALAQLQILNPGVQLVTEGLDELKEVRDGRIATPLPDEQ
ncbi:hypothetical protein TSUD_372850 [Trifolium subterraneum]|uniref:Uncharacterized protein n=1 Tax=Trifolium subterraneum TaxID=3900 RepID=A0A2Z6NV18_TRISU|nr:hypothetical protein TSUD_372850 [Trifolium subterraneum]